MPLSKCRYCGKMIPNPYRLYHEKVACIVARQLRGEYVSPEEKKRSEKEERKRLRELKKQPQKLLEDFGL